VASEMISVASLATPHIAGYSSQAKTAATTMLLTALEQYRSHANTGTKAGKNRCALEPQSAETASQPRLEYEFDTALTGWQIIERLFPLRVIDSAFRNAAAEGLTPHSFDSLRRALLQRQEFNSCTVRLTHDVDDSDRRLLAAVGIEVLRSDSCREP